MQSFWQDVRYGLRMLARNPGFSAIAVLTLALGIGANTAIFSLTDQILLRRLPVPHPEQLVLLRATGSNQGHAWSDSSDDSGMFSYPLYKDLRDRNQAFSGLLARFPAGVSVSGHGATELATAELVSGNYFEVLAVQPALGRVLSPNDETVPGANPLAVLSYGYWTRHFGSDTGIVGKQIVVNGTSLTVVGVTRSGFTGIQIGQLPDFFIPITMKAQMTPNWNGLDNRKDFWVALIGRLKPGIDRAKAEVALAPTYHAILESDAHLIEGSEKSRQKFLQKKLLLDSAANGRPIVQAGTKAPLLILSAMVALILLIACVNLASLLVARGEARQREIALRLTMGASRMRLVKQLLTESLLLSVAGGVAGITLASWTISGIVGAIPKSEGVDGLVARLDYRVLGFAIVLSIVTGVLFGLTPALRATRTDLQSTLKDQGANVSGGKANVRLRKWLLVSQVALTVILLAGAGFFTKSLLNLKNQDLGLRTDHVIQFAVAPNLNLYSPAQTAALVKKIRDQVALLPGVRSVSVSRMSVLAGNTAGSDMVAEGYVQQESEDTHVHEDWIAEDYFATMGIPLLAGREFTASDTAASPKVAIVSEGIARRFFGGRNPVGMHLGIGPKQNKEHPDIEIVGLVRDSKTTDVHEQFHPMVYLPYSQDPDLGGVTFFARTGQNPETLAGPVRAAVAGLDSNLPVFAVRTLATQVADTEFDDRLLMFFSACLGGLAALLAAIGLYGVMAYVVTRRTREIGIRMALGATRENVGWLILREVVRMAAVGLAIGLPLAYAVGRLVESQLFEVKASDPVVFVVAAVALATVAMLAGWLPARKAASVDPMVALRYE
ncbi:MAG TPA: ABC transporter permease [Candidatus Acidoferrales bacterium]|nr:ABC transporter permease [Candidatus Acidoferrales bacterium]